MWPIVLAVCFAASCLGAIAGFGGGVIIKPTLDALAIMPVGTVNFLSGVTVLSMSIVSLLRSRFRGILWESAVPLSIGSIAGGFFGNLLSDSLENSPGGEALLGCIQAILLLAATLAVFLYLRFRHRIESRHLKGILPCILCGMLLGGLSSFLGIGGGPYNMAILFWLFSLEGKQAAQNSLFIIAFSQLTSFASTVTMGNIPTFSPFVLVVMILGGVMGGLAGNRISHRISDGGIEKILKFVLLLTLLINGSNSIRFLLQI